MGFRLSAEEWQQMDKTQRIQHCIDLAEAAQKRAIEAADDRKAVYLEMAIKWLALAEEMCRAYDASVLPEFARDSSTLEMKA
jgi:HD superfamily phosphohydrolase YqeK